MPTLLLLLLLLVPAPKADPPKANPIVGAYALDWGEHILQTTFLNADGSCDSPEFGAGKWTQDADGYVWFSERDDRAQYVMHFDIETGQGNGWRVDDDGNWCGPVVLRIRRGERIPPPRVFE